MAKQTINIGSAANDGTGSTLRAAFDITNDNFTELYDGSGGLLHKIEGTNFTGSLLVGHSTTGTLDNAFYNTALGIGALDALTTGDYNIAIGYNAGTLLATGGSNTLIGALAGDSLTGGDGNVVIGKSAMGSADGTESNNVAIGFSALSAMNNNASNYNTAVGYNAGTSVSTGVYNTILGGLAGDALTTGDRNVSLGYLALSAEDTGNRNVAIGAEALLVANNNANNYNTAVGDSAGESVSSGTQNTIIGGLAGDQLTTGDNNIIIGYAAAASAVDVSNEVTIGNSSVANVRIPADSTLKIGASGDLQLEHLSSNSFIKNTAVGDLYIENQVDSGDVIFRSDDGSGGLATYFYLNGGDTNINFQKDTLHPDSVKAKFGTSADLQIYHSSGSNIIDATVGDLIVKVSQDDGDIIFQSDNGSGAIDTYFRVDGGVERNIFSKSLRLLDDVQLDIGSSDDFRIKHTSANNATFIQNFTGDLNIEQYTDDGDIIFKCDDGSGGLTEYFRLDGSNAGFTTFPDSTHLAIGTDRDFRMSHDGTDTNVWGVTGDIIFTNYADKGFT